MIRIIPDKDTFLELTAKCHVFDAKYFVSASNYELIMSQDKLVKYKPKNEYNIINIEDRDTDTISVNGKQFCLDNSIIHTTPTCIFQIPTKCERVAITLKRYKLHTKAKVSLVMEYVNGFVRDIWFESDSVEELSEIDSKADIIHEVFTFLNDK